MNTSANNTSIKPFQIPVQSPVSIPGSLPLDIISRTTGLFWR